MGRLTSALLICTLYQVRAIQIADAEGVGMTTAREKIAESFFRGNSEAASCLFDGSDDQTPLHVPGGAQNNPLLSTDWMPRVATLVDNHDLGPFEFDVILNGTAIQTRDLLDAKSQPSRRR